MKEQLNFNGMEVSFINMKSLFVRSLFKWSRCMGVSDTVIGIHL